MLSKMGVIVNWYRNNACKLKEVTEVAHIGALEQKATLEAISEAKNRSGKRWTFQLKMVTDNGVEKWLYKHNEPYDKLKERIIVTRSKQEAWAAE